MCSSGALPRQGLAWTGPWGIPGIQQCLAKASFFSLKNWRVNILNFAGHVQSVAVAWLCCDRLEPLETAWKQTWVTSQWAWFMDNENWIMQNFHMSQNVTMLLILFQPLGSIDTIMLLSCWFCWLRCLQSIFYDTLSLWCIYGDNPIASWGTSSYCKMLEKC